VTAETITRAINEAREFLEGKEGLEEFLVEFEAYIRGDPNSSEAARLAYRLGTISGEDFQNVFKLMALINLKEGLSGVELGLDVRSVYPSAWERL
jgi:hypothetical protein